MNSKQIFWDLFQANTEEEVDLVLHKYKDIFDNENNWEPYGGNKGNCGTFENQQASAVPALVEKLTNSIDAILMKGCVDIGIDPKSPDAPQDMKSAVEKFFDVENGEISELTSNERGKLADDIQIIATGDRYTPSILIYDNGVGQNHTDFKDTFLSLHNNNKADIQFVQGKYNMGSTGSVVFCGQKKYQLIGSRSNNQNNKDTAFGFTLVRRHPLKDSDNAKTSWYEYFCPNKEIPFFEQDHFDFGLLNRQFENGSIVKLYSYEFPTNSKGAITTDLYRDLNQYLFDLPIPLRVVERRDYASEKDKSKVILGNRARILNDGNQNVEKQITFNIDSSLGNFNLPINVIVFKKGVDEREYIKRKSLIFTINGQIHASEGWSYISQELNFKLIKKELLIIVDCTEIPVQIRQDLFMANRTHVKTAKVYETLHKEITEQLKQSKELRRINNERKDAILRSSSDKNLIKELMSSLPADQDLLNLLKNDGILNFLNPTGNNSSNVSHNTEAKKTQQKVLNRFPSIFKVKNIDEGNPYKAIPINNYGHVDFETDVSNDYLFRPVEKGDFNIEVLQRRQKTDRSVSPHPAPPDDVTDILSVNREGPDNGKIRLIIKPTEKAKVGDEVSIKTTLTSPGGDLEYIFHVKVDEKINKPKKKEKVNQGQSFPNLPQLQKAMKEVPEGDSEITPWSQLDWDGYDIVKVMSNSDDENGKNIVEGIVINMDSFVLQNFLSKNKIRSENGIDKMTKKYYTSIYLHSLFLYSIFHKMQKEKGIENFKEVEIDDFISKLIKPYANFLLYENHHLVAHLDDD